MYDMNNESARESQSMMSFRTTRSNYNQALTDFQDYAAILVTKYEKKHEWSKLFLQQMFDSNYSIKTYR